MMALTFKQNSKLYSMHCLGRVGGGGFKSYVGR
ncbi:hypothetical protein BDL97_03G092600 [Sphagnum fallax]|nr:hypothetical protein BDL97_03G092600 [Sphagnum fallax]